MYSGIEKNFERMEFSTFLIKTFKFCDILNVLVAIGSTKILLISNFKSYIPWAKIMLVHGLWVDFIELELELVVELLFVELDVEVEVVKVEIVVELVVELLVELVMF